LDAVADIFVSWLIPFVCGGIVSGCVMWVKAQMRRNSAVEDGVQCLLRSEILHIHDKYMELGVCPTYVKESIERMYSAYHALGGNDVATKLYESVMALPASNATDDRKELK